MAGQDRVQGEEMSSERLQGPDRPHRVVRAIVRTVFLWIVFLWEGKSIWEGGTWFDLHFKTIRLADKRPLRGKGQTQEDLCFGSGDGSGLGKMIREVAKYVFRKWRKLSSWFLLFSLIFNRTLENTRNLLGNSSFPRGGESFWLYSFAITSTKRTLHLQLLHACCRLDQQVW